MMRPSSWWCAPIGLALTAFGCAPSGPSAPAATLDGSVGLSAEAIAEPGMWAPPAGTLAIGDRQTVPSQGPPMIEPQGSCSSTNPWACSCSHPACSGPLPGTTEFARYLQRRFPQISSYGGFGCCRQNTGDTRYLSVHGIGRAIDFMIPEIARGEADNTAGDPVGNWLIEHAQEIGIQLVVWDRAAWNPARTPGGRLNPYTGPIPHTDHLHVELNLDGANRRTPFFTSGASTGSVSCPARCEGGVAVASDCTTRDCAALGAECIADPTPRCGVPGCPATGTATICLDEAHAQTCRDGLPTGAPADCGAYAAYCSTAGVAATAARCVSAFCVAGPTDVPVAHDTCGLTPGTILRCDAAGQGTPVDCPAGQICSVLGGAAHCEAVHPECPAGTAGAPFDDRRVCLSTGELVRCFEGNIAAVTDCGEGGVCSTEGGGAHCAQVACLGPDGAAADGLEVCTQEGDVATCDARGTFGDPRICPIGQVCAAIAGGVDCVPGTRPGSTDGEDLAPSMDADGGLPTYSRRIRSDSGCSVGGAAAGTTSRALLVVALAALVGRRRGARRRAP